MCCRRHAAFLIRLRSLAANPTTGIPAVKAAIRGYRASESSSRDLILTIWNVLDQGFDDTASIVNALVDLLDDDDKKKDLLTAWNGFKIEVGLLLSTHLSVVLTKWSSVISNATSFRTSCPHRSGPTTQA